MILFVSFHFCFKLCRWISPDGSVFEPHSDKNKARQRGCDLGIAGKKSWEDNSWAQDKEVAWGGVVGVAVKVLIVSRLSLAHTFNVRQT